MARKRTKPTLEERIAADPELQEIFARDPSDVLLDRLKAHHRFEKELAAARERRRARLRRLTFGLLGR